MLFSEVGRFWQEFISVLYKFHNNIHSLIILTTLLVTVLLVLGELSHGYQYVSKNL